MAFEELSSSLFHDLSYWIFELFIETTNAFRSISVVIFGSTTATPCSFAHLTPVTVVEYRTVVALGSHWIF